MIFDMTIQRRLLFGFMFGPIALLIIGWVAYDNTQAMVDLRNERQHTRDFLETIDDLLLQAVNMETGERGFLLTGNEAYLQPYLSGRAALDADLRTVGEITANEPRLHDQVNQVSAVFVRTGQLSKQSLHGAKRARPRQSTSSRPISASARWIRRAPSSRQSKPNRQHGLPPSRPGRIGLLA